MEKQKLVIICGPTASGKTRLAVNTALHFGGEVVSADSMQVYRGMNIGTAKPTEQEARGVPHHMLDNVEIGEEHNAAEYRERARACIAEIGSRGKLPILCGGTGLYISAVVYPLSLANTGADIQLRTELQSYAEKHGASALHGRLGQIDPAAALKIHPNNVRRVVRAIEKAQSADPIQEGQKPFNGEPLYSLAWIGLAMEMKELYGRIDERVDGMMERGLLNEVHRLAAQQKRGSTAFQALGYKELLEYINGKTSLDEAVARIKTGTRNYAKRQMTWFRREKYIRWFAVEAYDSLAALDAAVFDYIKESLHIS